MNLDSKNIAALSALDRPAEWFRTLGHPLRLRMIQLVLRGGYAVGDLADACGIPSHQASEHLSLMRRCGLLASEQRGRQVYYRVAEPALEGIMSCVDAALSRPDRIRDIRDTTDDANGHQRA